MRLRVESARFTCDLQMSASGLKLNLRPLFSFACASIIGIAMTSSGYGQTIGVAAPLSGSLELLGKQVQQGAGAAADALSDRAFVLDVQDDACSSEGGQKTAQHFVETGTIMVIGFLCTEALSSALPLLKEANIPVITIGVRTNSITDQRDKTGWPVFRLAPRDDAEADAIASLLLPDWRDRLFAIVDDGTIYGRNLAESFRAAAESQALKPVFVDTYRPQLENQIGLIGRLRRAGATHVFVGGDREDIAIMERDAQKLGYELTVAAGEALRAATLAIPPADGTLMIAPPDWSNAAALDTIATLREQGLEPDGYVLPTYAAMEIAATAISDAETSETSVQDVLASQVFTTAIGEIQFTANGDLNKNPYRLYEMRQGQFQEVRP